MAERVPLAPGDRWLAVTTVSFDISALELYLPLLAGATVVLADADTVRDPAALAGLMAAEDPTVMQATPTLWQLLADTDPRVPRGLRAPVGGEALPAALADTLAALLGASIWSYRWFDPKGRLSVDEVAEQIAKLLLNGYRR